MRNIGSFYVILLRERGSIVCLERLVVVRSTSRFCRSLANFDASLQHDPIRRGVYQPLNWVRHSRGNNILQRFCFQII